MTTDKTRRNRIETNALLLERARYLLHRVHLRFTALADTTTARDITQIIHSIDTERQRWLRHLDNPLP
jgi:hypothetical protein